MRPCSSALTATPKSAPKKLVNKPELGHFKKAERRRHAAICASSAWMTAASYEVGQVVKADVFAEGDKIDITGISKGHGFTGAI